MKKTIILAAALVLVLTGCGTRGRLGDGLNGYTDWLVQTPNPLFPNIFVDPAGGATPSGERLIVDQEPIHVHGDYASVTIRWALRAGSEYQFPDKKSLSSVRRDCTGADLAEKLSCSVEGTDGKTLGCVFPSKFFEPGIKYCYSITVKNTKTGGTVRSDPSMVGD